MTVTEIHAAIRTMTDEELRTLNGMVVDQLKANRAAEASLMKATLKPGDTVILKGLRPASLNGRTAEVVAINRSRAVITLDGRDVTVPLSCVELYTA